MATIRGTMNSLLRPNMTFFSFLNKTQKIGERQDFSFRLATPVTHAPSRDRHCWFDATLAFPSFLPAEKLNEDIS